MPWSVPLPFSAASTPELGRRHQHRPIRHCMVLQRAAKNASMLGIELGHERGVALRLALVGVVVTEVWM